MEFWTTHWTVWPSLPSTSPLAPLKPSTSPQGRTPTIWPSPAQMVAWSTLAVSSPCQKAMLICQMQSSWPELQPLGAFLQLLAPRVPLRWTSPTPQCTLSTLALRRTNLLLIPDMCRYLQDYFFPIPIHFFTIDMRERERERVCVRLTYSWH